jgi:zinc transport system ATP-binding protein
MAEPARLAPPDEPLIELRDVTAGYGDEVVLDGVSLAVGRHDALAVIGPNGGGKTTLLKLMLGLVEPWRGEVVRRLSGRPGAIGYVPQFAGFDKSFPLRVREVVRMGRLGRRRSGPGRRDDDRRAVDAVLERFGLTALAATPVAELSGGQVQRTLIARALVSSPEILLLDEPLASVDPEFRGRLVSTLKELARSIPVVVVTHDLTPFATVVRQIACVNRTLHYHPEGRLSREALEEVYGCPVELIAHGVPHRVLAPHRGAADPSAGPTPGEAG